MCRSLHPPQVLLTLASVVYLFVATPSTAQVQTSALAFETETLDLEIGARGRPPSSGLSTEEWRAITRYIQRDRYAVKWTAESGPGERVNEDAKLLPSDGVGGDFFGWSVAVSGDTAFVGAWADRDQGVQTGSAYVFEKPGGGWSGKLSEAAKLLASDGAGWDWFGHSVAASGDTVFVGAWGDDDQGDYSGSVYVFEKPVGGWSGILSEAAKLLASDGTSRDDFGYSVAVSGDTVVVGARGYYSGDQGAAYIFEKPVGGWSGTLGEAAKLLASDGASRDAFGSWVAISDDTVVVGAWGDDDQGDRSGSAYVFEKPVGGWSGILSEATKLLASDGASLDNFGTSVAVSGDTVFVGAIGDDDQGSWSGSAYVFEEPGGGWSGTMSEDSKLRASDGTSGDNFGTSVAVSGDTVVVGASSDDDQGEYSGSVYVFEKPAAGWSGILSEAAKLLASDGTRDSDFGISVAVSGATVFVGNPGDNDNDQGEESESAYVFVRGDSDSDGVLDELDVCADTVIPEGVPTRRLGSNRFALVNDDGLFDTTRVPGTGPGSSFSIGDTGGCSCEQIIDALDASPYQVKFGCTIGTMRKWVAYVSDGADGDADRLPDILDICTDTAIPEAVPTMSLGANRFALVNDDTVFDTNRAPGIGPGSSFSIGDTGGCSCEQIIDVLDASRYQVKFGCTIGTMRTWVDSVSLGPDSDGDTWPDILDICPDTVIPEAVPTVRLGANRFALFNDDTVFDTNRAPGIGPGPGFSIGDTGGCSCEQIIDVLDASRYQVKFGCTIGTMRTWVDLVNP